MKRIYAALLVLLLLCGCGKKEPIGETSVREETEPPVTIAPDGNPNDVTCRGSYTGQGNGQTVIARVGERALTNAELAVWYWAEVSQYRQTEQQNGPDFSKPLDTQPCGIDDTAASWQQYFLSQALDAWHAAAALNEQSLQVPLETEEAYQPNRVNYAEYMTGMPATKYLFGYEPLYVPNSMHQAYLDAIADTLGALAAQRGCGDAEGLAKQAFGTDRASLEKMAEDFNRAYMYFTQLTYNLTSDVPEEATDSGEYTVNFRHILLRTDTTTEEEALKAFRKEAEARLKPMMPKEKTGENAFADLAHRYSEDTMSALDGGSYLRVEKGQLPKALEDWCFAPERQSGDMTTIVDADGIHLLYFSGREASAQVQAETLARMDAEAGLIRSAMDAYPMEVSYGDIQLPEAEALVSCGDLLYPDVAHERYPEVPLYLQQDYGETKYGGFLLRTNGCGITSMAMTASYLADEYLSPPEMCRRFYGYSHRNGTDGMIFLKESSGMNFYLVESTYDPSVAWQGLQDGHLVISVQHKGYWTRAGHYIVLEKVTDSGKVQVRDSNIYNYRRVEQHQEDEHTWGSITASGSGFWIFDYKITKLPGCPRCGTPEQTSGGLVKDYYCRKCAPAQMRRNVYLNVLGQ